MTSYLPHRLLSATYTTVAFLQAQNLRLSLHKCNLKPVRKIEWLGKCISHRTVSNKPSRSRQIAGVLLGIARCRSSRVLRRLLGWVSWYASHFSGALRALSPAYAMLNSHFSQLPWEALWAFALTLALGSIHVKTEAHDTQDSGPNTLYCDASASNGCVGICDASGSNGITVSYFRSVLYAQQSSELFAAALSHVLLLKKNLQHCTVAQITLLAFIGATNLQDCLLLSFKRCITLYPSSSCRQLY